MNHVRVLVFAMLRRSGAGAVIGIGRTRSASAAGEESSFSRQLHLTPQQETQIREIWSKMLEGGPREDRRRADLREQRDAQIAAFSRRNSGRNISRSKSYQTGIHSIEADRDAAFASAEEKTRDLLTPEQAKKFDEMMHHGGPRPGMPLPGPPPFMDEHHPHGPPPSGF